MWESPSHASSYPDQAPAEPVRGLNACLRAPKAPGPGVVPPGHLHYHVAASLEDLALETVIPAHGCINNRSFG